MDQENINEVYREWYEVWMKQSEVFFACAKNNIENLLAENANPEEHKAEINQWLDALRNQWQLAQSAVNQQAYLQSLLNFFTK